MWVWVFGGWLGVEMVWLWVLSCGSCGLVAVLNLGWAGLGWFSYGAEGRVFGKGEDALGVYLSLGRHSWNWLVPGSSYFLFRWL